MERETMLRELGFNLNDSSGIGSISMTNNDREAAVNFSGYSEFTPITVSSETVITNAHLEPNQSRN